MEILVEVRGFDMHLLFSEAQHVLNISSSESQYLDAFILNLVKQFQKK